MKFLTAIFALLILLTAVFANPQTGVPADSTKLELLSSPKTYFPINLDPTKVNPEVRVKLNVNESGGVDNAVFVEGDPSLQEAAMAAVLKWRFKPFIRNGQPIPVNTIVTIQFLPNVVRISQGVLEGLCVKKFQPIYPEFARAARIQGSVVLHVVIATDGSVKDVKLVSGHPMLTPAAIDAVKRWKYRPYLLNGIPMEVDSMVTVNFTLG